MLNIAVAGKLFAKLLHRCQNLLALGQIGSKREACDSGVVGTLLQRVDGIVDFVEIGYFLGRVKSMNGQIEQVGKTQELRLHLRV